jgi:hypothetical protein
VCTTAPPATVVVLAVLAVVLRDLVIVLAVLEVVVQFRFPPLPVMTPV